MSSQLKQREASVYGDDLYLKPEKEPFKTKLKRFAFNPENGAIFGRTPSSWGKIGLFYLIFYIVLATMFACLLWLFSLTLDPRIPKWRLDESIIGTNPGLGFRPMPNDSNSLSTLIWYKGTRRQDYEYWVESLREFLDVYRIPGKTPGRGQNIYKCDFHQFPPRGKVCDIDVRLWDPCTFENTYNYHLQKPCIFLKVNKIYDWVPDYYKNVSDLPERMPDSLKAHIQNEFDLGGAARLNQVWLSCQGESPADVENIGEVKYYPGPGFPGYFFPFENSEGYLSPLVAVQFTRPRTGILINIECRAWAHNIKYDRKERIGSVHFELMID
uniref:Sodium/potassium-transporting ATPase subunit beta n=1 Tax=Clastoptera arizonana TaxID=38151 RepID=A0A1B6D5Z4_9HEMI